MSDSRVVRAGDIASVATCERMVYLRAKYGDRTTARQKHRREEGIRLHAAAYVQGDHALTGADRRCFIASAVYGTEAPQTCALRAFRDRCLMPSKYGRWFVAAYYRCSPAVARYLSRHPALRSATIWVLDRVVRRISHP